MIDYTQLTATGILGGVLSWFMFRNERVMNNIKDAIKGNTEVLILVKEKIKYR